MDQMNELNQLLEDIKENKLDSFDLLYELTHKQVYLSILSIIKDASLAEEILQETYYKVLKYAKKYKSNTNVNNWIITIARNEAKNAYNKRKREMQADSQKTEFLFTESPNRNTPLLELMYSVLKENEIELILLHVIHNLTHKEIAKKLNKPLGTILWQYNQAIKKLKEKAGEMDERYQ